MIFEHNNYRKKRRIKVMSSTRQKITINFLFVACLMLASGQAFAVKFVGTHPKSSTLSFIKMYYERVITPDLDGWIEVKLEEDRRFKAMFMNRVKTQLSRALDYAGLFEYNEPNPYHPGLWLRSNGVQLRDTTSLIEQLQRITFDYYSGQNISGEEKTYLELNIKEVSKKPMYNFAEVVASAALPNPDEFNDKILKELLLGAKWRLQEYLDTVISRYPNIKMFTVETWDCVIKSSDLIIVDLNTNEAIWLGHSHL
jgi:hypothetical protein